MNCPKCGSLLPPNVAFCPVCNEPVAQSYTVPPQGYQQPNPYGYAQPSPEQQPSGYPPQNGYNAYPQQGGYQQQAPYGQGYSQFNPSAYPTGYQQPFVYGEQRQGASPLLNALSKMPHAFLNSFRAPADVLREMLERNDRITCPVVMGVVILLSFLAGMTIMRGFVGDVFNLVSLLTGVSMAGSASSMNQGINYVAGRIAPSVGGVAALCQLIAILVPGLVLTLYLTAVCKLRFSLPAALGLMAVPTYPTAAVALAAMALSFATPWLSLVAVVCGMMISYVQMGALLSYVTGRTDAQLFRPKLVCFAISLGVTLLALMAVGGSLMSAVLNRMLALLTNVGSLI